MVFSSVGFVFVFLPVVLTGYFLLHRVGLHTTAKWFLVAASFAFYAVGSPGFVLVFMASVGVNFLIGRGLSVMTGGRAKKALLAFGVVLNVALLGYYKYTDFFIANWNALTGSAIPLMKIVLPIGISFFTFQLIAYLADSWHGLTSSYQFLDYLLFITFFPQLIVGPIVHHAEMVPQFEERANWRLNWNNVAHGIFVFTLGLAKKLLLADAMTQNAQSFFDAVASPVSAVAAWWYAAEYTISYYFDLSGYADMAIGIGLMFNVRIPENFNSPYKARNFQDYWQRWHITLSRFLSNYVFRSIYRKGSRLRSYYMATMATFFVSGFWHGAGWTFVAWGLANGALVCVASAMKRKGLSFPAWLAHGLTLIGIVLMRILFVSNSFSQAATVFRSLVNFVSMDFMPWTEISPLVVARLCIGTVIVLFMPTTNTLANRFKPRWTSLVPVALVAGLAVAYIGSGQSFLYFQF